VAQLFSLGGRTIYNMNLRFCAQHDQQLHRALTTRSLYEFGWRTEPERKEAISEQSVGHYSRKNFNPFIMAWIQIVTYAGDKLGKDANGCPVCLLDDNDIIDRTAKKMAEVIKNLPDE